MRFDSQKFITASKLPAVQANLRQLAEFINADSEWSDVRHVAYFLATTQHETAGTFGAIVERGAKSYFDKYNAGTKIGKRLGNVNEGDGFKYRGRGYVQITGRDNYAKFSRLLGVDLIANPDRALDPQIAYKTASIGMRKGKFTGRDLDDYIDGSVCNYVDARRIINGTDKAENIAALAKGWEKILRLAQIHEGDVLELDWPPPQDHAPDASVAVPPAPVPSSPETATEKATDLSGEIVGTVVEFAKRPGSIKSLRTFLGMLGLGSLAAIEGFVEKNQAFIYIAIAVVVLFSLLYFLRQWHLDSIHERKQ